MKLPILLFLGGTHGNFLAKCLSVASGIVEDFDFYGNKNGAHNKGNNFTPVVNHVHQCDDTNVFAYIKIKPSDLYVLEWHTLFAAGELGINALSVKDFNEIEKVISQKLFHSVVTETLAMQVNTFNKNGISGLREMFKKSMTETNGFIKKQAEIFAKHKIDNLFEFSWFYDQELFCKGVEKLLIELGYEYKIDILHHQKEFVDRKLDILQSKKLVELAFRCYTNNTSMDISNFCIYEQAYLDNLIEQHHGHEIELYNDYPTNTIDLKPIKAWEGKKYDL
tara:strand:+ start:137 stop:973 length:837 start_codon:yes stop_codon:yes gene_type:complete